MAEAGQRWPNLFVVGAAKAGTTSLYRCSPGTGDLHVAGQGAALLLSDRTDAGAPRVLSARSDKGSYLALFDGAAGEEMVGEASTSYLWEPETAGRIRDRVPEASILIMLRDPVERAYSQYWNDVREGLEKREFLDALNEERRAGPGAWGVGFLYIDCGLYATRCPGTWTRSVPVSTSRCSRTSSPTRRGRRPSTSRPWASSRRGPAHRRADEPRFDAPQPPRRGASGKRPGAALAGRPSRDCSASARGALLKRSARPPMDAAAAVS